MRRVQIDDFIKASNTDKFHIILLTKIYNGIETVLKYSWNGDFNIMKKIVIVNIRKIKIL